jgi:hypothetical protein
MPMRNPESAISFLTGEVHALFMITQALVFKHPNPQAMLSQLDTAEQLGLANLEPHPIENAVIDGFQFVMGSVRGIAAKAVEESQRK